MGKVSHIVVGCILALSFSVVFASCSGKEDMLSEMSGVWKNELNSGSVRINLAGESKTIEVEERVIPITIKNIRQDIYAVIFEVKDSMGKMAEWSLREVWDDTGSEFTIEFRHDDKKEILKKAES